MRLRNPVSKAVTAVLVVAALVGGGAGPSVAEPSPASASASVSGLAFASPRTTSGGAAELRGMWSLPSVPSEPAGFSVSLPAGLEGRPDRFPLAITGGLAAGECTVTATEFRCELKGRDATARPADLHGSFAFWVTVTSPVGGPTPTSYRIGAETVSIVVAPPPRCTSRCTFAGRPSYTFGTYYPQQAAIDWIVVVGAGETGMRGGEVVVVRARTGANQRLAARIATESWPVVWATNRIGVDAHGAQSPIGWQRMPATEFAVDGLGGVRFTTRAGYFYDAHFAAGLTDQDGTGARTYLTDAVVTIDGRATTVRGGVLRQGGRATAAGAAAPRPTAGPTSPAGGASAAGRSPGADVAVLAALGGLLLAGQSVVLVLRRRASRAPR